MEPTGLEAHRKGFGHPLLTRAHKYPSGFFPPLGYCWGPFTFPPPLEGVKPPAFHIYPFLALLGGLLILLTPFGGNP